MPISIILILRTPTQQLPILAAFVVCPEPSQVFTLEIHTDVKLYFGECSEIALAQPSQAPYQQGLFKGLVK